MAHGATTRAAKKQARRDERRYNKIKPNDVREAVAVVEQLNDEQRATERARILNGRDPEHSHVEIPTVEAFEALVAKYFGGLENLSPVERERYDDVLRGIEYREAMSEELALA